MEYYIYPLKKNINIYYSINDEMERYTESLEKR